MSLTVTEMKDIYGELLKRYKEYGYLHPENALNYDIRLLESRGKTTGKAILRQYKGAKDDTIELLEQYIATQTQIPETEEEKTQPSISKGQMQEKSDEIREIPSSREHIRRSPRFAVFKAYVVVYLIGLAVTVYALNNIPWAILGNLRVLVDITFIGGISMGICGLVVVYWACKDDERLLLLESAHTSKDPSNTNT